MGSDRGVARAIEGRSGRPELGRRPPSSCLPSHFQDKSYNINVLSFFGGAIHEKEVGPFFSPLRFVVQSGGAGAR